VLELVEIIAPLVRNGTGVIEVRLVEFLDIRGVAAE
jgi:hypothetical protein